MPTSKKTIFYVDDDPDDRDLIKDAFVAHANEVELFTFENSQHLFDYIHAEAQNSSEPCLIILDINMPVISGKEALKTLRTIPRFENVPVVLFTTSTIAADKAFAKSLYAELITKPVSFQKVKEVISYFVSACGSNVHKALHLLSTID